jgi:RNA polymerase-binding transcription factor DksA
MATPRKSRAAPSKRKSASAPKRPAAPKKAKPPEHRPAAPAAKATGSGAAKATKAPARATAQKAAATAPAAKGRPTAATVPAAKRRPPAAGRSKSKVATPPPPVRPLGVLPPESRAKGPERHAAPVAAPARPVAPARKSEARPESAGAQPLTSKDLKHFEELLKVELQKIRKEMGHLETTVLKVNPRDSSGDLSGYSFHMADAGTDAMEREKAFLYASVEGRKEREIVEALQRIFDGTYGVCENCGQPIVRARLEAVPYVRLCVSCKQKEEQASRSQPG